MATTAQPPRRRSATRYLQRPEGDLAYDVTGDGPLVICAPGMGDVRGVYRSLSPALVAGGYRVATVDLRGHGESATSFTRYDDVTVGQDLLALVDELGAPAVLVGNSMSAGAAVWAAAEAPERIRGLVLLAPFVRDVPVPWYLRAAMLIALRRPWGPAVWLRYYASLYAGSSPPDLAAHQAEIARSLRRPGAWEAFLATTRTSHRAVEDRLGEVACPTLVVMGTADPDFPRPADEATLVAERLGGEVALVEGAGHYPQAEAPTLVAREVLDFLGRVTTGA